MGNNRLKKQKFPGGQKLIQKSTAETVKSWSHTAPEHQGCMIRKLVTKTNGGKSQVLESHSTRAPRLDDPKTDTKS